MEPATHFDHDHMVWRLQGVPQNYAWGQRGSRSAVARLLASSSTVAIDETKPYAELWWAAHPSGCGSVQLHNPAGTCVKLSEFIAQDPERILGQHTATKFGNQLPYLLKVLSIRQALSVQAHPDKELAAELHQNFPSLYADSNHKPEIAIALSKFKAMCGFRKHSELVQILQDFPEFRAVLPTSAQPLVASPDANPMLLRAAFEELMTADHALVQVQLERLIDPALALTQLCNQVRQVYTDFPGDSGVFCLLMLNVVELQPGEALYLAPNEPHAYFEGDCVECMANSDNVVRAGLTPKFKHVETLVRMLTYRSEDSVHIFTGQERDGELIYAPPIPEFQIGRTTVEPGSMKALKASSAVSILICVSGGGFLTADAGNELAIVPGNAFLLAAGCSVRISCSIRPLTLFRATVSGGL